MAFEIYQDFFVAFEIFAVYNIRCLNQEFAETDRVVLSSTTAIALDLSDSKDLYTNAQTQTTA